MGGDRLASGSCPQDGGLRAGKVRVGQTLSDNNGSALYTEAFRVESAVSHRLESCMRR